MKKLSLIVLSFCWASISLAQNNIIQYEYWFDGDYFNKVIVDVPPSPTLDLNTSIQTEMLETGLHSFNIRFKDDSLNYNSPLSEYFLKTNSNNIDGTNVISAYRYWFDDNVDSLKYVEISSSSNPFYLIQQKTLSHLQTGEHIIHHQFQDNTMQWSGIQSDTFFHVGEPQLDKVIPNKGGNIGEVTSQIQGAFYQPLKVRLEKNGQSPIEVPDSLISLVAGQDIFATFNLTDKELGTWDLIVEIVGDTIMQIENGFLIEEGIKGDPTLQLIGSSAIRVNVPSEYSINISNTGNIDLHGVPVWISVPTDVDVQFSTDILTPEATSFLQDSLVEYIEIDTLFGEFIGESKVYCLFLSKVPPNYTSKIGLKINNQSLGNNFQIRAWVSEPLYGSPFKNEWLICIDQGISFAVELLGTAPGGPCIISCLYSKLRTYLDPLACGVNGNFNENGTAYAIMSTLNSFLVSSLDCVECVGGLGSVRKFFKQALSLASDIQTGANIAQDCIIPFLEKSLVKKEIETVNSLDPNEKYGPTGVGEPNFLNELNSFNYLIKFENIDSATAKAQTVLVSDTLDTSVFDLNSFQLGNISIGDSIIIIPPNHKSITHYYNIVSIHNVVLRITANLDEETGIITWFFESLDPQTMLPTTNPVDGFLPPNLISPEGQGSVSYSINLKEELPVGTEIKNQAFIYFDNNPPIATQEWLNTLDNIKPHSQVNILPAEQSDTLFTVSWGGTDTISGIKSYDIFYATNEGDYILWLGNVDYTSLIFEGQIDSTYRFYSIATDFANNIESTPEIHDASTTIVLTHTNDFGFEDGRIKIYPNPTQDFVTVEGNNLQLRNLIITINNELGQSVFSTELDKINYNFKEIINTSKLNNGSYFIEFFNPDSGSRKMKKLIKIQ